MKLIRPYLIQIKENNMICLVILDEQVETLLVEDEDELLDLRIFLVECDEEDIIKILDLIWKTYLVNNDEVFDNKLDRKIKKNL
jgi:hypothetical protein